MRKAIALEPGNASLHDWLAQLEGASATPSNLGEAQLQARRATELNPYKSDYWLTPALSLRVRSRRCFCADQAFDRARALSPMVPRVWWAKPATSADLRAGRGAPRAFRFSAPPRAWSPDYAESRSLTSPCALTEPRLWCWRRLWAMGRKPFWPLPIS